MDRRLVDGTRETGGKPRQSHQDFRRHGIDLDQPGTLIPRDQRSVRAGGCFIAPDASEEVAVKAAQAVPSVQNALGGLPISKVIYKAGRILNLIVKA